MAATLPQPTPAIHPAPARGEICIEQVDKIFARTSGRADSIKGSLIGALSHQAELNHPAGRDLVQALRGIDLHVAPGEAFGVIGPNGSGKSTLLKLIAGISAPTRGRVAVGGRVLGLLELGAGFHPDLTGEENIRLQAALYGIGARRAAALIDPILDFAGLRDFRALPVRHYSSGMFVRLGFAIAVHAEPDVLLVDEVLAVGDEAFQQRCLQAIDRLRAAGTTLLLVTHYPDQLEAVCTRALWLEQGAVRQSGSLPEVMAAYYDDLVLRRYPRPQGLLDEAAITRGIPGRYGSGGVRVTRFATLSPEGTPRLRFAPGAPLRFEVDYAVNPDFPEPIDAVDCTLLCESADSTFVTMWRAEADTGKHSHPRAGRGRFVLEVPAPTLLPGRYGLTLALTPPGRPPDHYDLFYKLYAFSVAPPLGAEGAAAGRAMAGGLIRLPLYALPEVGP